ncbi:MAG: amino acid permease, partial [Actinobacteria bacterium]|nr:amino acid permease [Actinomycetota bacterium]
ISQIAKSILGDGAFGSAFFILVQAATMLILFAGANTTYSAFPILVNFVANDGYLPSWLTKRGHRLNFSNGIMLLTVVAMVLVVGTGASVEHLVAFYALGVFTAFTLTGFGMAKHATTHRDKGWRYKFVINGLSGFISLVVVIIFAIVKFTEGAWIVIVITPILVMIFLRLRRQYTQEQGALNITVQNSRATSITRHDVTVLIDNFDLATIGAIRYARSLNPRNLSAVHFVIDDRRAEAISREWAKNEACSDVPLELIDCPDRRLANAAVDYAVRATASPDVELTLLLPRRSYSKFLGWLLHDQTAESIASPISQLERVVATIVPFDVEKILSGQAVLVHPEHKKSEVKTETPARTQSAFAKVPSIDLDKKAAPVSHYAENILPIGNITWRKRAQVQGRVNSIKSAPANASPSVEVEVWDETGGVTLQFLGRREITGLEVGAQLRAEGMVGENNGQLIILNPSYEIVI